ATSPWPACSSTCSTPARASTPSAGRRSRSTWRRSTSDPRSPRSSRRSAASSVCPEESVSRLRPGPRDPFDSARLLLGRGRVGGPLAGRVALVAGATRGAGRGIAVQLGAAGATVYVTGRTTRLQRSEMNRPETIEETAGLVDAAGGRGIAVQVDHLVPDQVRDLVARIDREQGRLHVLVNDIWGATTMEWKKSVWESTLEIGLRTLRLGVDTHAITRHIQSTMI